MDQYNVIARGATGVRLRTKIRDLSANDGSGKTTLAFNSTGLIISTICDNEATPTVYTAAGLTIETIAALGTYAAPTATKCRFKEVDATNHPGLYELQFANARFAVAGAKRLTISLLGVADMEQTDLQVDLDLFSGMVMNLNGPTIGPSTGTIAAQ